MQRSTTLVLAVITMVVANTGFAQCPVIQHSKVPAITDLSYHDARTSLLRAGWQPLNSIDYNDTDDSDIRYGNEAIFWNKGYSETETCAGTGLGQCIFNFADIYGNNLKVVTIGEESPEYNSYATVNRYWLVCEEL
ncbi:MULTISPECIES: hypothetical protein [Psychrobacter]|uniref:Uncharacterized protein n=1 Tax=Psychrobacter halodurans TaxID=2818439 RepID=A0AAW4IPV4_9GAMM|nr:hypothetical protein [Psychrobacter halodurans]MBO1517492.1 hypothetical protein [Psychrobacter halodurans]